MKDFEHNGQAAELNSTAGPSKSEFCLMFSGQGAGVSVARAVQSGIVLDGVFVEAIDGEIESRLRDDQRVGEVTIPNDIVERRKFFAAWSEAARKNAKKGGLISILLLPLAACGGDGDGDGDGGAPLSKGFVIDGYVANGFIFRDDNENGVFNDGEASSRTESDGSFTLGGDVSKPIVVDGSDGLAIDLDNPTVPFTGLFSRCWRRIQL